VNIDDEGVEILGDMMRELKRLAREGDSSVSDVVNEALRDFLSFRGGGVNYYDIISAIERGLNETGLFAASASAGDYAVRVKSYIRYRRRPELKYEVRIDRRGAAPVCKISASLRSDDVDILRCFTEFTALWAELEREYARSGAARRIEHITETGYFARSASLPGHVSASGSAAAGAAVSDFVHAFDELLKGFRLSGRDARLTERQYVEYVKAGKLRI